MQVEVQKAESIRQTGQSQQLVIFLPYIASPVYKPSKLRHKTIQHDEESLD